MKSDRFLKFSLRLGAAFFAATSMAFAEPQHGIAMYGDPALPPDFVSLPYANPNAPTGGLISTGEVGSFDSLNPHIRKGRVPWQLRFLAHESLMGRSWDEPFTLYGLIAESVEADPAGKWVEFTLRPEARFSDGSPITMEDVIWSYETLGTVGHPRYQGSWAKVDSIEAKDDRTLRITFKAADREMALIMGMRPILKKAQFDGVDFAESGLDIVPISSAPYVVGDYQAGRYLTLKRNPDYWGKDVPFRRGTNVIDEIRMEFFGDATAMFEAFKAGEINTLRETNAAKWDAFYNFPRVTDGAVVKSEIPHKRPSGIRGFVMNTRKDIFKDWRVREALITVFNYEFINQKLNGGEAKRITSYFSNSVLGMQPGEATDRVAEFLAPFADDLVPGTIEGYTLPVSDGSERNRAGIRRALDLLSQAGWEVKDGVLTDASGQPFKFEILLKTGSSENEAIVNMYRESLERLGIFPSISIIDQAQYQIRVDEYDFDMTDYIRGLSLSPGNEQLLYWGSDGVQNPGTRNWMGVNSPAVEALVNTMVTSESQDDYVAAVRALDRVLTAGRYVIPIWFQQISYLAHDKELKFPERLPIYGDFIGFQPDVWWYEE